MKKITFSLGLSLLILTSCEKNWTCDCDLVIDGEASMASYAIMNKKKSDAKPVCSATEDNFNRQAGTSASCEFK